jgi:hypothetical protein
MYLLHYCLSITGYLFCGVVLLFGFWKRRIKEFPLFFAFLASKIVVFLVMFPMHSGLVWRSCTLLAVEISFALELAMLYQLAAMLVFSNSLLVRRLTRFRRRVLAILIFLAALVSALTPAASHFALVRALEQLSIAQDVFELGLLLTLAVVTWVLGISWRSLPAGIARGWGISSSVNIAAMLLLGQVGPSFLLSADTLRMAGFHVCTLVWLWYVVFPEPAPNISIFHTRIADLDRYSEGALISDRFQTPSRSNLAS